MDFGDVRSHFQNNEPVTLMLGLRLLDIRSKIGRQKYDEEFLPYIIDSINDTHVIQTWAKGLTFQGLSAVLPCGYSLHFHEDCILAEEFLPFVTRAKVESSALKKIPYMKEAKYLELVSLWDTSHVPMFFKEMPLLETVVYQSCNPHVPGPYFHERLGFRRHEEFVKDSHKTIYTRIPK